VPDAKSIVKAMLLYNIAASALLVYASLIEFSGAGLWSALLAHIGLAIWCVLTIKK